MSTPILATKLYIPPPRPKVVLRSHLIERLNAGLRQNQGFGHKLTLISAPAGFGKTTLVSEWIADCQRPIAWLSLDEGDNDPARLLTYLVVALQTMMRQQSPAINIGESVLAALQSPQPPATESVLTTLLNEITTLPNNFILVLDDYHVVDAKPVDAALAFLIQHLPPQMHLVIATREDPNLPLARLRVQGQLTELRATDLRFTTAEAAAFLNEVMGLALSTEDIAALETRTEGWIAGLQLASLALQGFLAEQGKLSIQGHKDATSFIKSFTGSHHFVLDYLVEEVLQQQPETVQTFLLRTSILDRLCGSLCDAVLQKDDSDSDPSAPGEETLAYLEHVNLFLIPLDNERRWYRYHHLFAELLRQRLGQSMASSTSDEEEGVAALHRRASIWYENNNLEIEAFRHAAAANDIERAERLIAGGGMPLHFRGAVAPVLTWLASLPTAVLDARPSLWVTYASALSMTGQTAGVEQKLQAAEAVLQALEPDDKTRNLIGHIAAIRALLAASQNQVETIITQSRRALAYLHPDNLPVRTATIWKMGIAYELQGDRAAASQAYTEAISISQASGNVIIHLSATIGLGNIQAAETKLYLATETYQRVLHLTGDMPQPIVGEAHLGLARIFYEWNDLDTAQQHGQQSMELMRQLENNDRFLACDVLLARLKLAQGDTAAAADVLVRASQTARQHNFAHRLPEIAAVQVSTFLRQGKLAAAVHLAEMYDLPLSQARAYLAQGNPDAALSVLAPWREHIETKGWADERLKVLVLQAMIHYAQGEENKAAQQLMDALVLAESGGFIRLFVDEGLPMAQLLVQIEAKEERQGLSEVKGIKGYIHQLLAAFEPEKDMQSTTFLSPSSLVEPLSERELEVLQLIAQGLSNREIGQRLFLALSTVKGHNRIIFGKLQVKRRTEAVARARELGLL